MSTEHINKPVNKSLKSFYNKKINKAKERITNKLLVNRGIVKIKNLHLMMNSLYSKIFIEFINKHFDINDHYFLIWGWESDKALHINPDDYSNVEYKGYLETIVYCNISDKVFVHYLSDEKAYVINACGTPEKFYWIFWGYDFYSKINIQLYEKFTKDLMISLGDDIQYNNENNQKHIKNAIEQIQYILHYIEEDYYMVKSKYNTDAKMLPFFYPNAIDYEKLDNVINFEKEELKLKQKYKYVIQVGNSATPTNNHLDIFDILNKKNLNDCCVLTPLSYGFAPYSNTLISLGNELLKDKFIPIESFIQPNDYFYLLSQVDVAIMNNIIHQALGNILALLYLGKKLYINPKSTTYSFLNRLGFKIYSTEDLDNRTLEEMMTFTDEYKSSNKCLIKYYFNEENARKNMETIFNM